MTITLNWGILGAGNISSQFVHDLILNNITNDSGIKHIIRSIGTSSNARGQEFAKSNNIIASNNFGVIVLVEDYDDFFVNKEIDIVYVGTPHSLHKEQVIRALENGKHVLCEKPLTVNAPDARELIELAISKKRYLMEAMWTRFFPSVKILQKYLFEDKLLGEVHRLFADFSSNSELEKFPPTSRARDINLAAGSLLDIGIYSITYARILLDDKLGSNHTKFNLKSFLTLDKIDKVDHSSTVLIKYENGKQGILTSSNYTDGPQAYVRLEGSNGHLEMFSDNPARPKKFKLTFRDGSESIVYEDKFDYNGFIYEANAIAKDIDAGRLESSIMPHEETLLVMEIMDNVRKENGLRYPQDN